MRVEASRRAIVADMALLLHRFEFRVMPVTHESARRVAAVCDRWGKAVLPAGLNFCGCMADELARHLGSPLRFAGQDFSRADIAGVL